MRDFTRSMWIDMGWMSEDATSGLVPVGRMISNEV